MPYQVTVASGLNNVVLPDGLRHKAGDVVTLTNDEYGILSPGALSSLFSSVKNQNSVALAATTGTSGFALQNATPSILTWTAPNDGAMHRVSLWIIKQVTSVETGGSMGYSWVAPSGSNFSNYGIDGGNNPAGFVTVYAQPWNLLIAPGNTFSLNQTSALTAGSSKVWAEIWAL